MEPAQYKKVLELMLDLEKKMDNKIDDIQVELRKDMAKYLDDKDIKTELQLILEEKLDNMEFGFNSKIMSRLEILEKAYDSSIKNFQIIESKIDLEN
jgi:hypothetical protein